MDDKKEQLINIFQDTFLGSKRYGLTACSLATLLKFLFIKMLILSDTVHQQGIGTNFCYWVVEGI